MNKRAEAAAKALYSHLEDWQWESTGAEGHARAALAASDAHMFSQEKIVDIVSTTGLSIQSVTEVIRALKEEAS